MADEFFGVKQTTYCFFPNLVSMFPSFDATHVALDHTASKKKWSFV